MCLLPGYDEEKVKRLRTYHLTADELAVATRAFVSPTCYAIMKISSDVPGCPFSNAPAANATLEHCVWLCTNNNKPQGLQPGDDG